MKIVITLALIFMSTLVTLGQPLPAKIVDQPDGLTLGYFNVAADTCLPQLFIGDTLQILFPCYNQRNYKRIDISKATVEIKLLREILTEEFILKLSKCCIDKNCPDTGHYYFLMIKKGNKDDYQYLDLRYTSSDKCGSKELNQLIELLNKINKNYR